VCYEEPLFLLFHSAKIRFCSYSSTHKICGNTFGICVFQDFEALTPGLITRVIDTVTGGGCIIIIMNNVHTPLNKLSFCLNSTTREILQSFNERFFYSLVSNPCCILIDDKRNIYSELMSAREIDKIFRPYNTLERSPRFEDDTLACSFKCQYPLDSLIKECFNFEQAKVLLILLDKIVGKEFGQFTSLVGARGRGKSASLGLAIAGALVQGIINIIISAPALENTQIFFKFVIKGLQSTHLFEHTDYEVIKITNAFSNYKSVVQIKLLKKNHPSIRYLSPVSYPVTKQVELLVIEETSEIPQTLIERMLGPYPVFASFTQKIFEEHVRYSIQRHKREAKKKR
jgi:N-acetyltransferase 10